VSLIKEGPLKLAHGKAMKTSQAVRNLEIWKAGGIYGFSFATVFAFTTWFPTLFERFRGTDPIYANLLATVVMLAGIICADLWLYITQDQISKNHPDCEFRIISIDLRGHALFA
jgi:nitrate/nitrite transporter NarK